MVRWLAVLAMVFSVPAAAEWKLGTPKDVPLVLDGLPRQTVAWTDHGKARSCDGVWLTDLLGRSGAPVGDAVRGAALTMLVLAEAADDYQVVFSLGETDGKLGAARLLVADWCDGLKLGEADGPLRIVAAGEARGARSVRQLRRLTFISLEK